MQYFAQKNKKGVPSAPAGISNKKQAILQA